MNKNALAPKVLEQSVVREVDNLMNLYQIYHWRNQTGALKPAKSTRPIHFGKPGSSDFLGICNDGRFLAVECKRPCGEGSRRYARSTESLTKDQSAAENWTAPNRLGNTVPGETALAETHSSRELFK